MFFKIFFVSGNYNLNFSNGDEKLILIYFDRLLKPLSSNQFTFLFFFLSFFFFFFPSFFFFGVGEGGILEILVNF